MSRVLFGEWLSLRFRIKCKPLGLAAQTRLNHSCGQSSRLAAQPGRLPAPLCRRLPEQRLCVGSVAFSHAWVPLPARENFASNVWLSSDVTIGGQAPAGGQGWRAKQSCTSGHTALLQSPHGRRAFELEKNLAWHQEDLPFLRVPSE